MKTEFNLSPMVQKEKSKTLTLQNNSRIRQHSSDKENSYKVSTIRKHIDFMSSYCDSILLTKTSILLEMMNATTAATLEIHTISDAVGLTF